MRAVFIWAHRWFGVVGGIYFVLMGLSGSYLAYAPDIDALLKKDFYSSESRQRNLTVNIEAMVVSAKIGLNTEKEPARILVPSAPGRNITLSFNIPKGGEGRRLVSAFVDPETSKFNGSEVFLETIRGNIFTFHHDLFLGRTGRTILAVCGVLMLMVLGSGIYLWWQTKSWIWKGARNRLHWHLEAHKLVGLYTFILMAAVTFSGVYISRPDWFQASATERPGKATPPGPKTEGKVRWDLMNQSLASLPLGQGASFRIDLEKGISNISYKGLETSRQMSLTTGQWILPPAGSQNEPEKSMRQVQREIHGGDFWGTVGKFLVFVSGLLPLYFFWSGIEIFLRKRANSRPPKPKVHGTPSTHLSRPEIVL